MISNNIQSKLCEILMTLAEEERNVEITRQVLTENKYYNSYQIFCYLDNGKKNKIDNSDILNFLKNKNIFSTEIEVNLLILFYDDDLDTNLNFDEFINLIESKSSPKRDFKENNEPICFPIEYSLTKLLEKEIIYARKIITLFEDLKGFSDFDIHNIFHFLKDENINSITPQNIIKFFNHNYVTFIDNDIELIFKRIDKAKDKIIDLCEFHLFFGFPICEYNCPYPSCNNCGLEPCESCKIEGQCPIHIKSNFKNDENKILNERTYKTYYTEFLNKNNKKEEKEEEQLNNGYQKISNNLTLQLSPKREYAPFEVAFDSKNIFKMSNENYNLKSGETFNDENINTINQNFIEKNQINNDLDFKSNYIINKQNLFNNNIIENNENIDNNNEINFKSNIDDKSINRSLNKNEYEEKQFLDYLRKSMEHENKIENLKIELSLRSDFYWEQVFRIFEFEGSGYLSKEDLIKGFKNFNLYPKDIDITLFLKRYDLKKEGSLSYPDFFELIVPFSKYHRLMVENRKINTDLNEANPNEFNSETQKCIKNLFNEIFIGEFSLNKDKETFSSLKKQFNNIFKTIDSSNNGFIGEKDFVLYIQNNGLFKSSNDCDLLFRRFNKLRNGKIDYQEIIDEIEPIY